MIFYNLTNIQQCLQENEFRPKDLKIYIEGEPVASVEDLMNHFEVGYHNQGFTEDEYKYHAVENRSLQSIKQSGVNSLQRCI